MPDNTPPKTYILRLDFGDGRGVSYGTIPAANLEVAHPGKFKRSSSDPLRSTRVGTDKSQVNLTFRRREQGVINDKGGHSLYPGNDQFKLLRRHEHIREVRPEDLRTLEGFDARLEAKRQELRDIQEERAKAVRGVWRRSAKLPISELEERASGSA